MFEHTHTHRANRNGRTKTGEQAVGANKNGRTSCCAAHFVLGVLFLTIHSTIYLLGLAVAVWAPCGMVLSAGRAPDGMVSGVALSPHMVWSGLLWFCPPSAAWYGFSMVWSQASCFHHMRYGLGCLVFTLFPSAVWYAFSIKKEKLGLFVDPLSNQ